MSSGYIQYRNFVFRLMTVVGVVAFLIICGVLILDGASNIMCHHRDNIYVAPKIEVDYSGSMPEGNPYKENHTGNVCDDLKVEVDISRSLQRLK